MTQSDAERLNDHIEEVGDVTAILSDPRVKPSMEIIDPETQIIKTVRIEQDNILDRNNKRRQLNIQKVKRYIKRKF